MKSARLAIAKDESMVADMFMAWLRRRPQFYIGSSCCDAYGLYRVNQLGPDKMSPLTVLGDALEAVAAGKNYFSQSFREQMERQLQQPDASYKIISQREIEILHLLATGLEDEEIAVKLAITTETVKAQRRSVRRKLNLHTDQALISRAQNRA